MELKYVFILIITSLLVSIAFHMFIINQVKNWFDKFFRQEERRMIKLLSGIKKINK